MSYRPTQQDIDDKALGTITDGNQWFRDAKAALKDIFSPWAVGPFGGFKVRGEIYMPWMRSIQLDAPVTELTARINLVGFTKHTREMSNIGPNTAVFPVGGYCIDIPPSNGVAYGGHFATYVEDLNFQCRLVANGLRGGGAQCSHYHNLRFHQVVEYGLTMGSAASRCRFSEICGEGVFSTPQIGTLFYAANGLFGSTFENISPHYMRVGIHLRKCWAITITGLCSEHTANPLKLDGCWDITCNGLEQQFGADCVVDFTSSDPGLPCRNIRISGVYRKAGTTPLRYIDQNGNYVTMTASTKIASNRGVTYTINVDMDGIITYEVYE